MGLAIKHALPSVWFRIGELRRWITKTRELGAKDRRRIPWKSPREAQKVHGASMDERSESSKG
jgi:hypothetical protein